MTHTAPFSLDIDSLVFKGSAYINKISQFITAQIRHVLAHPFFRDINATYIEALHYPMLDALAVRVLWIHGIVLALLLMLNSYTGMPAIFPSPLGWRIISITESLVILAIALLALAIPLLVKPAVSNHYIWRIILSLSLAVYSYLFIYVSGGAIAMHFHMVLVMAFIAVYADWRLEWLLVGFYAICSFALDALMPTLLYASGHTMLSVPLHIVFILVMAYFTTVLCQNHRMSIEALVEAKRRNDQFLAIASHELRTPLTSMKGYAEVLERRLKRTSQSELLVYATKLDDQLSRMTGLIRDLLDVSKIQSGHVIMRRERLSMNSIVGQAIEEVQAFAHHHKIVVSGWVNTPIIGDPIRLSQVLVNLLSNAMKYSPTSDRVVVKVSETRDKVIISVQDFGIGIPAKERVRIFEPYFRSQNAQREDVPGGLGMGLYIAAEIVHRHGGRIWLDSEEGVGSTFSFLLPLAGQKQERLSPQAKEATNV